MSDKLISYYLNVLIAKSLSLRLILYFRTWPRIKSRRNALKKLLIRVTNITKNIIQHFTDKKILLIQINGFKYMHDIAY